MSIIKKHKFFEGLWEITYTNKDGEEVWKKTIQNALVDQGEYILLSTFFRNYLSPASFYIGLANGDMNDESTLTRIPNEPTVAGYSRQTLGRSVSNFPLMEKIDGDWAIRTGAITFTAGAVAIGPVDKAFMATGSAGSGYLISYVSMPAGEVTVQPGDSLSFYIRIKAM